MPEIPDIEVFTSNIKTAYAGEKISRIKVINEKKLSDTQNELSKVLRDKVLLDVYRSGKEMRFKFSGDVIMGLHLMLSGDIVPFAKVNERKSTIIEFYFSNDKGFALVDRLGNAFVKLYPVDKKGIDALDKDLNFKYLKSIFENKKAIIKNVLIDQNTIRGIGNSYSDEILWECRISPFSITNAIPDDKIKELAQTIKPVLHAEIKRIKKAYPNLIHGEVKEFMKIHSPQLTQSPTGKPIKSIKKGMMKTYYTDEQILYK